MKTFFRWLLLPFSLLYTAVVWGRNRLYDAGVLQGAAFHKPVLVVGNLEVGGTGKTPMTEYLISLLSERYRVATLSRGYGRRTRGFREVHVHTQADESGDEPLQFKQKFPEVTVAVDEKRVRGVQTLLPDHDLILLDDAYQHRALRPGFSILLFDYTRWRQPKVMLPTGDYRDQFRERRRADLIVVTKCPNDLAYADRQRIRKRLEWVDGRPKVFFSTVEYATPLPLSMTGHREALPDSGNIGANLLSEPNTVFLLVTGIARPQPLANYLKARGCRFVHRAFPDHHRFTEKDLHSLRRQFEELQSLQASHTGKCVLLTTEKDAKRLSDPRFEEIIRGMPVFILPIRLAFLNGDQARFDELVLRYASGASSQLSLNEVTS